MNPNWSEGQLEFDFSRASQPVLKLDALSRSLKSVDFWAQYRGNLWLIEVKDPEGAPASGRGGAIAGMLKEIKNDELLKTHLLPKLYGTFAYLVEIGKEPRGLVRYGILIGISGLTAADRTLLANKVQRIIDRIGPKVRHSRHWPIAEAHNVASWNHKFTAMTITRHP